MPPEIHEKLASFAADRDETCFAQVVEEFGGLVFNAALRRTGNRQVAEEVAQNVFAIVARKAPSLSRHPQLTAWFHTTTRFEASKAMQSRRRYQKRIEKLADEMNPTTDALTIEEQQSWRDALPQLDESLDHLSPADREIVYGRFFEDRSFKEIAERSRSSEAACKMRLKRALGKLNGWLTGRGVTLSATALATGLMTEFSKAAPAAVASSLPSNAIAASSSIGTATILTNTLQTMSTIKTTTIAAVAILTIGGVPVVLQHSEAHSLKGELAELRESAAKLSRDPTRSIYDRVGERQDGVDDGARPVAKFLAELEKPLAVDEMIETVSAAMMSQDMSAIMRIILPLSKLSPEAGKRLIADVRASEKSGQKKGIALQFLSTIVNRPDREDSPGDALDQNLRDGVSTMNLANNLGDWVKKDPDAAIAWYNARRDSGQLAGKGINDNSDEINFFSGLIDGLAQTDPKRAMALLEGVDSKTRTAGVESLVPRLAVREDQRQRALDLLNSMESVEARGEAARRTASLLLRRGMPEAAMAFIDGSNLDDRNLAGAIGRMALERGGEGSQTWAERVAWAQEHVPESARDELTEKMVMDGYLNHPTEGISEWISSLPAGPERDAGLSAQSTTFAINSESNKALESAQSIGDEKLRDATVRRVFAWAKQRNAEAAAQLAERHGLDLDQILKK